MVLSYSSLLDGATNGDGSALSSIVNSTTTVSLLAALVLISFVNQLVKVLFDVNIPCERVWKLWCWKKRVVVDIVVCPRRRERYLRCLRRCEQRRRKKLRCSSDNGKVEDECCWSQVSCPFSRAALCYKLHLPAPLPFCGKKERRATSVSSSTTESTAETSLSATHASSLADAGSDGTERTCPSCPRTSSASSSSDGESAAAEIVACSDCQQSPPSTTLSSSVPRSLVIVSNGRPPRYRTSLIDLARMQQWTAILERTVTRRDVKHRDGDGLSALHWACSGGPPVQVVQALLEAYPSAVKKVDVEGSTPLHFASHYSSSPAVVRALVERYPRAASIKDKYGRTPMYHAVDKSSCIRIWQILAEADPSAILSPCVAPTAGTEATIDIIGSPSKELDRSAAARTPLFLAWISVISNRQARTTCQGKCWEKALYLLEAAWRHKRSPPSDTPFHFLPVAVAMDLYLPEQVVTLALQSNPEQLYESDYDSVEGAMTQLGVLTVAASMDHFSQARCHALILQLLEAAKKRPRPAAAGLAVADGRHFRDRKRSPLLHAAASGKVWTAGLRDLLEADPDALRVPDPESKLSAALLAASAVSSSEEEEVGDNYDPLLLQQQAKKPVTNLFLRRYMDPFGFLTSKHHDRIMNASGLHVGSSGGFSGENEDRDHRRVGGSLSPKKLKTDGFNTVYELVRADPVAALFLYPA
jgi:hypothetical protein